MATTQQPKENEQTESSRTVRRLALSDGQRQMCCVMGVALMIFGCFLLVWDEPSWPAAVPLMLGGGLFLVGLVGHLIRFRLGQLTVEPSGPSVSDEAGYGALALKEPLPEQAAPPLSPPQEPDLAGVGIGASDEETVSEQVEVNKFELIREAVAALGEKDYSTFDSKMQEAIACEPDEGTKVAIEALRLEQLYSVGQTNRLEELQALREKHPTSPYPVMRLGDCYDLPGGHEKAADFYAKGLELPKLTANQRLMLLARQAGALRKAKLFEEADTCLTKGLERADTEGGKAEVEKLLAELYEDWGKKDEMLIHLEKALDLSPGDVDARFGLAYEYSQEGYELAAFHHYDILRVQRNGSDELNNLAIILRQLDAPITAARFYRRAANQKDTLAAANLARMMARGGMAEQARDVLAEARKEEKVDEAVDRFSAAITRWEEDEEKRLNKIREAAATERALVLKRLELERQHLSPFEVEDIEGTWKTSVGDMTFQQRDKRLVARFKHDIWDWELTGEVSGRTYSFGWTCDRTSQNQEGDGFFIFKTDDEFEGIIRHTPQKGEVRRVTGSGRKPPAAPEQQAPLQAQVYDAWRRRAGQG